VRRTIAGHDVLVLKGVHRCGDSGRIELVVVPQADEAKFVANSVPFLGLEAGELADIARPLAREITFYGNTQGQPYDRDKSGDLIMIAQR